MSGFFLYYWNSLARHKMKKIIAILFLFFFSFNLWAQKTLSLQASYSVGSLNIISPPFQYQFYDIDITQDVSVDILYYVSEYIQIESGVSYGTLNFKYLYQSDQKYGYKDYQANADIYAMNYILSFPFGMSFIYPFKKHRFLLGAKVVPTVIFTNNQGYFKSSGNKYVLGRDSTYYVENYYTDNEINRLVYPKISFQYHIGYQYHLDNGIGFSVRFENAVGRMSGITRFNRYTLRFGAIVRIVDYSKKEYSFDN